MKVSATIPDSLQIIVGGAQGLTLAMALVATRGGGAEGRGRATRVGGAWSWRGRMVATGMGGGCVAATWIPTSPRGRSWRFIVQTLEEEAIPSLGVG